MSREPFRIIAYTDATGLGGAEISLGNLIATVSDEFEMTVVGVSQKVIDTICDRHPQVQRLVLSNKGFQAVASHLYWFRRLRPHLIHCNLCTPWACSVALTTALLQPNTRVVRVDQLPLRTTDALTLWRTRFLCLRVDAHVAVGKASTRLMEDFYALGRDTVISIPNGVPDIGVPEPSTAHPRMVVGSVGRLDAMKAHDVLIRAIAQTADIEAFILGDGEQRQNLEHLARDLGVGDRIHFLGWVDNPRSYLPKFDVVAMPSRSEGFPLAMVEAMLAAKPVVATRVGSIPEAIIDGETGILIDKNDTSALVQALQQLRDNPQQRRSLGERAREMAVRHFTVEAMTTSYENLWRSLINQPRHPRLMVPRPKD
jgi:glycosyltransferase involved in cell wall biosynthesis